MRLNRNRLFFLISALAVFAFALWWAAHVPEPKYEGIGLGVYISNSTNNVGPAKVATAGLGGLAVPYLVQQMKPDPLRELLFKAAQKLPGQFNSILNDRGEYQRRRAVAAFLLLTLGTNAVTALPAALQMVEASDDRVFLNAVQLLRLAPGTEHETRALHALLHLISLKRPDWAHTFARRIAYDLLPNFTANSEIVIPALVKSLHEPGGARRIDPVVRFGTNAIPALRIASASETNHVRPATVALERITNGFQSASPPAPPIPFSADGFLPVQPLIPNRRWPPNQ